MIHLHFYIIYIITTLHQLITLHCSPLYFVLQTSAQSNTSGTRLTRIFLLFWRRQWALPWQRSRGLLQWWWRTGWQGYLFGFPIAVKERCSFAGEVCVITFIAAFSKLYTLFSLLAPFKIIYGGKNKLYLIRKYMCVCMYISAGALLFLNFTRT